MIGTILLVLGAVVAVLALLGLLSRQAAAAEARVALLADRLELERAWLEFAREEAGLDAEVHTPCPDCDDGMVGEGEMAVPCPRCGSLGTIPLSQLKDHERKYLGLD